MICVRRENLGLIKSLEEKRKAGKQKVVGKRERKKETERIVRVMFERDRQIKR